jgi:hypothetical protein
MTELWAAAEGEKRAESHAGGAVDMGKRGAKPRRVGVLEGPPARFAIDNLQSSRIIDS